MKEALDKVKDLFAPLENMIIEAEEMVKIKMLGYNRILQAEEEKKKVSFRSRSEKEKRQMREKLKKRLKKLRRLLKKGKRYRLGKTEWLR